MFIFNIFIILLLGLYFGSFITAIALRISADQKIFVKYSKCDFCNKKLSMLNLIPIFGYLFCKGKCVNCKQKISIEYTLWEILHSVLWCINYIALHHSIILFTIFCAITSLLVFISIIDIKTMYIYDAHIVFLFLLFLLFFWQKNILYINAISFIKALIPLAFKAIYEKMRELITKEKIVVLGMGDVKLFAILFFFLDFYKIAVIVGLAGVLGVLFFYFKKRTYANNYYPFIPAISVSIYCLLLCL